MKKLPLILLSLISLSAFAQDILVKSLEMRAGDLVITTVGDLNVNPSLTIKDKTLEVTIPNAHIKSKIVRNTNNINLTATQFDRSSVKVLVTLNDSIEGKENLVNITLRDRAIFVSVPKFATLKSKTLTREPGLVEAPIVEKTNEKLDESYLVKLENEQKNVQAKADAKKILIAADQKQTTQVDTDRVNVAQSSVAKMPIPTPKASFSVTSYIGKFVAFLSLMILGFYGVLTLFKKGVIKKGRLGFLHSTKLVEVLSTTHVAPKRSLIMVKAHKQVFLISNSETGMQLISEIQDVNGLITTGELELTGSNFQTNLVDADKKEKEFKLKEDSDFSLDDLLNETPAAKSIAKSPVKDEVRLSDQIKSKLKNLKQLQ